MTTTYKFNTNAFMVTHEGKEGIILVSDEVNIPLEGNWLHHPVTGLFQFNGITRGADRFVSFSTFPNIAQQFEIVKGVDEVDEAIHKIAERHASNKDNTIMNILAYDSFIAGYQANKGKYSESQVRIIANRIADYCKNNYNSEEYIQAEVSALLKSLHPSPIGVKLLVEKCDECGGKEHHDEPPVCSICSGVGQILKKVNGIIQAEIY